MCSALGSENFLRFKADRRGWDCQSVDLCCVQTPNCESEESRPGFCLPVALLSRAVHF